MERFVVRPSRRLRDVVVDSVEGLRKCLEPSPEFEEAIEIFSHNTGCSQVDPLRAVQEKIHIPGGGGWDFGMTIYPKYLVCDECEERQEFRGDVEDIQRCGPEVSD